jgi:hypothetical protein
MQFMNALQNYKPVTLAAAALVLALTPLACGDDDPAAPTEVATADLVTPITAANAAALDGVTVQLSDGAAVAPQLAGLPTTVEFNTDGANPTVTITVNGQSVVADLDFGSCIFTFPTPFFGIPAGFVNVINPCTVRVGTNGQPVNSTSTLSTFFVFGPFVFTGPQLPVTIDSNGVITLGGIVVGTVPKTTTS